MENFANLKSFKIKLSVLNRAPRARMTNLGFCKPGNGIKRHRDFRDLYQGKASLKIKWLKIGKLESAWRLVESKQQNFTCMAINFI